MLRVGVVRDFSCDELQDRAAGIAEPLALLWLRCFDLLQMIFQARHLCEHLDGEVAKLLRHVHDADGEGVQGPAHQLTRDTHSPSSVVVESIYIHSDDGVWSRTGSLWYSTTMDAAMAAGNSFAASVLLLEQSSSLCKTYIDICTYERSSCAGAYLSMFTPRGCPSAYRPTHSSGRISATSSLCTHSSRACALRQLSPRCSDLSICCPMHRTT